MSEFETLETTLHSLLTQPAPPPVELRKAMLDLDEWINSEAFSTLSISERDRLQALRKDLKQRLRMVEEGAQPTTPGEFNQLPITVDDSAGEEIIHSVSTPAETAEKLQKEPPTQNSQTHQPEAESWMEEAERLFYSGRYQDAIRLFDRVLQVEPKWERARQHRNESENYLRTGYIPPVALPAEAASAFGKAQSAARVGRYADALALLGKAQSALRELGIQRWQEGMEFEQKLQENIDAENVYQEGLKLFDQGRLDEAIESIETASRATGLPKYADKAQELRQIRDTLRKIHETLSALNLDPKNVAQSKADLDLLTASYGENPFLQRLRNRLDATIPRAIVPLKEQARSLKNQADRSATLEETRHLALQARQQVDQIRKLQDLDENQERLSIEIDKLLGEVTRLETELSQARTAYDTRRNWPAQAARLSQEVRERFPADPGVIQISRQLARFFMLRALAKAGGILFGILVAAGLIWVALNSYQDYQISLTPTVTATATATATATPMPTLTATATITPTPTKTLTPTPTPIVAITLREVWARSNCYEGYPAIGKIPLGVKVDFLPAERRFDDFSRECVLVSFQDFGQSIIGWVLISDLGPAPAGED